MAKRLSTQLRNELLGYKPSVTGTTIGFTVTSNIIADSGAGLAVFRPGDKIVISGAGQANNNGLKTVVSVNTAGTSMVVSEACATEGAGSSVTIALLNSRGFKDVFKYCIIEGYSGAQPADADSAETGTKLIRISVASGAVVPGIGTNGLSFGDPGSGSISKANEVWSGVVLADGVIGWFRLYTNMYQTGAGATKTRMDGSCGISGAQLNLSNLSLVSGATLTIDNFTVNILE